MHINPVFKDASAFRVDTHAGEQDAWIQAVEMYDGYFKRAFHAKVPASRSGSVESGVAHDILKVVVIDRHHGTENCGIAFVRGFGLKKGAIACTTNVSIALIERLPQYPMNSMRDCHQGP